MQADGTIDRAHGAGNMTFAKLFTDRTWAIAAAVSEVAAQLGRSPAQVALNWVAHRPGVTSTPVGATRAEQLEGNLRALEFEIPRHLLGRLDEASQPEPGYPYYRFAPAG
jgi:aryl-alcohol dehydrogenase-like predicted oxidoreductase